MWSVVLCIALVVIVLAGSWYAWSIREVNKLLSVLSYTTFMTGCEIAFRFNATFRPYIFRMSQWDVDYLLEFYEQENIVIGRDPTPERCHCKREYCLTMSHQRTRKQEIVSENQLLPDDKPVQT